ncbi:MAG: hypothetical protein KDA24_05135 [Deltaproteobacteria bacterium]|nr:hypothetical protein [Deltaproteobacteria bacterium]
MKPILATLANFFFPGAGYLILGQRIVRSLLFLVGVIGLTYVELNVKTAAPDYYLPMFISVLVMNTGFAIDAWLLAKELDA